MCCPYIHGCGTIHQSMVDFLGSMSLKNTDSPSPSNHQLSVVVEAGKQLHAEMLTGLILFRSYADNSSCCEYMSHVQKTGFCSSFHLGSRMYYIGVSIKCFAFFQCSVPRMRLWDMGQIWPGVMFHFDMSRLFYAFLLKGSIANILRTGRFHIRWDIWLSMKNWKIWQLMGNRHFSSYH